VVDGTKRSANTKRGSGARRYVYFIALVSVGATLGVQTVAPGLPALQDTLHLSDSQIGWFTTAYVLPGVVLTLPLGFLSDAVGRRSIFCITLLVYGAAGVMQGVFTDYPVLLALRGVQGASFGALMPLTITLIGDAFSGPERAGAVASRQAVLTASEVVLPVVGASLAALSWRAPFLVQAVNVPLAALGLWLIGNEKRATERKRYARDLVRVFKDQRGMMAVLLTGFARFVFKLGILAYVPVILVNQRSATLVQVGIVISGAHLVAAGVAALVPRLTERITPSTMVMAAVPSIGLAMVGFAVAPGWEAALGAGVLYGAGDGVLSVLQDTYAIQTARQHVRAGMISVSQTARNLGKLIGPLAMTAVVAVSSVATAFVVMAFAAVLFLPFFLPLRGLDEEMLSGAGATPELSAPISAMRE
jgi:MFS transporter, ACDE family, multidrug resistance protein